MIEQYGNLYGAITSELEVSGNASGATNGDYEQLSNLPSIEQVKLVGDKSLEEFGVEEANTMDILNMF